MKNKNILDRYDLGVIVFWSMRAARTAV